MLIRVTCPHCGVTGRLRDDAQGSRVLCPRCGMRFDLPASRDSGPAGPSAATPGEKPGGNPDPFGSSALSGFYESATVEEDEPRAGTGPTVIRRTVVAVKGTKEWGEWLASASKVSGMPAAAMIEVALAEWATRHGYPAPPGR